MQDVENSFQYQMKNIFIRLNLKLLLLKEPMKGVTKIEKNIYILFTCYDHYIYFA